MVKTAPAGCTTVALRWRQADLHAADMVDIELTERDQIIGQHQSGSSEVPTPSHVGASVASGVLNMSNTILGAGMLALPHALAQSGLLVGLLLLALFAALSLLGLHLVSAAADLAGRPSSFYAVAEKAVPGSGMLIDAAIAVKCFGVATAYLIIVGDAMPQAVEAFGATGMLLDRRTWTLGAPLLACRSCGPRWSLASARSSRKRTAQTSGCYHCPYSDPCP